MQIQLNIPNEMIEAFRLKQPNPAESTQDDIKEAIKSRLVGWLPQLLAYKPSDRSFLVGSDDRRKLEAIFETTIEGADDLIRKVGNLSKVAVGPIEFHLSPGEVIRLKEQAVWHGWTPEEFVKLTCREIMDRAMERI